MGCGHFGGGASGHEPHLDNALDFGGRAAAGGKGTFGFEDFSLTAFSDLPAQNEIVEVLEKRVAAVLEPVEHFPDLLQRLRGVEPLLLDLAT